MSFSFTGLNSNLVSQYLLYSKYVISEIGTTSGPGTLRKLSFISLGLLNISGRYSGYVDPVGKFS